MFVNNFLAPIQVQLPQTLSVIPLATGDEVIKFWQVKVGGGGMHSTECCSSCRCYGFYFLLLTYTKVAL